MSHHRSNAQSRTERHRVVAFGRLRQYAKTLANGATFCREARCALINTQPPMRAAWKVKTAEEGGVERTHNVTRWRDADMVQRWVASAWVLTEKHFRRVDGHADLWALATILGRETGSSTQLSKEKAA